MLKRIRNSNDFLRPFDQPCLVGTSVWNSASATSQAEKEAAITDADLTKLGMVRWSSELYQIAPNRSSTRVWTYFDHNAAISKTLGLFPLVGLTEGVQGGTWDCTDKKGYANFSAADHAQWVILLSDCVERMVNTHGFSFTQFAVTLLNEPDNDSFGTPTDGTMTTMQMNVLDWMATYLRSRFPDLIIVGPSLSIVDSTLLTQTVISDTYFVSGGKIRPCWQVCDYIDVHMYPNQNGMVPPPGPPVTFAHTRETINNVYTSLAALTGGSIFATKPLIISECNVQFNYVQQTTDWVYGSDDELADIQSAMRRAFELDERIHAYSVYNWQNGSSGYDTRTDNGNFGLRRSTGQATRSRQRLATRAGVTDSGYATASKL